jgi:hypothetical protein
MSPFLSAVLFKTNYAQARGGVARVLLRLDGAMRRREVSVRNLLPCHLLAAAPSSAIVFLTKRYQAHSVGCHSVWMMMRYLMAPNNRTRLNGIESLEIPAQPPPGIAFTMTSKQKTAQILRSTTLVLRSTHAAGVWST